MFDVIYDVTGCRWLVNPSSFLAILVAVLSLALGSASLAEKNKVFSYLDNDGSDAGLSSKDISLIKTWYNIISYGLFGLFALEIIRFIIGRRYRESALRIDGEFDALLSEDDRRWNNKISENKSARGSKYEDLRAHYKAKYAPIKDVESGPSASSNSGKGTPARF